MVSSLGGAGDGGAHICSWFALDDGLDGWALDGAGADAGSVEGGSAEGGSAEGDPAEGGSSEGGSAEGGSGGGAKHLSMAAPIPKASGPPRAPSQPAQERGFGEEHFGSEWGRLLLESLEDPKRQKRIGFPGNSEYPVTGGAGTHGRTHGHTVHVRVRRRARPRCVTRACACGSGVAAQRASRETFPRGAHGTLVRSTNRSTPGSLRVGGRPRSGPILANKQTQILPHPGFV